VHFQIPQIPGWDLFVNMLFEALKYLWHLTGDWGMAIILLTIAVRIVLLPLTWKQTKSMVELQRIQPKLKELQEKYKDDKEKQQEEMLKFYQENKVNPLGGCLPLVLQMPVLIALYGVVGRNGAMLKYLGKQIGTFYQIIPNLAKSPQEIWNLHSPLTVIPYALLVAVFAVSIWLPQALMPGDKQQKMMGGYMAIIMLWFGWVSPAGVLLYWDVSSIWGVIQQQITLAITNRELASEVESAKAPKQGLQPPLDDESAEKKPVGSPGKRTKRKK
jgi:YidC/Oxa1 family membrane protein insertase